MGCSGSPVGVGVVAVHVCLPSSRDGFIQPGRKPRVGEWNDRGGGGGGLGIFGHLLLPADKYQPAEVLEADVELVAPADLPPICAVDIICGKRGKSQPWNPPSHPSPAVTPLQRLDTAPGIGISPGEPTERSLCCCTKGKAAPDWPIN